MAVSKSHHGLDLIWEFIERHNRLQYLTWILIIAVPCPILWTVFAICLGIPHWFIRFVAIGSFMFAICYVWAVMDATKKPGSKSALDNVLAA